MSGQALPLVKGELRNRELTVEFLSCRRLSGAETIGYRVHHTYSFGSAQEPVNPFFIKQPIRLRQLIKKTGSWAGLFMLMKIEIYIFSNTFLKLQAVASLPFKSAIGTRSCSVVSL